MTTGVDPNDIYHNGVWYSRSGAPSQWPNYRASVGADCTVWAGPAKLVSVDCVVPGVMASVYDSTTASGTVLRAAATGAAAVEYTPTAVDASVGIHADWTSGAWEVVFTAPRQTYTIQAISGWRTIVSDGSSNFTANTGSKKRQQVFAGPNSVGLVDQTSGAGLPLSVQFGTGAADGIANTAFTATPPNTASTGMEAGGSSIAPCLVEVDGSDNQSMGYGRVSWDSATGVLRLLQKADDALVSGYPRVQLYSRPMLNRTAVYYIHLDFALGDAETPWPVFSSGKNTTLIFQLKGGSSFPPFDVQVRDAASGDTSKRDLYFLRRLANAGPGGGGFDNQGQDRILVVSDVVLATRYTFALEVRFSWIDGEGWMRIYKDGAPVVLHSDVGAGTYYTQRTLYSSATPDVLSAMWGLYRLGYSGVKASDDAALILYRAEVETMVSPQGLFNEGVGVRHPNAPSIGAFDVS